MIFWRSNAVRRNRSSADGEVQQPSMPPRLRAIQGWAVAHKSRLQEREFPPQSVQVIRQRESLAKGQGQMPSAIVLDFQKRK